MAINKQVTFTINPDPNCEKLDITWVGFPGLLVSCINNSEITFELDPNSPENCIEAIIVCTRADGSPSCNNCEPIHFRKCFCSKDKDCGDCATCQPDGTCKDTCTEEEKTKGKLCYDDGCGCPPSTPYDDPILGCVECLKGQVHPTNKCLVCKDGFWKTKVCPDGVCDQTTGDCIPDCSKNTNGKTRYNPETKQCDCERNFRWSTIKNTCVPDEDCKPGFERNPLTDECDPIDCGEDYVYSVELDECVEKPCEGDCTTGLDCAGKDCGCDEATNKCVKCKDNPNALGCNDNCGKESCDDNNPCTGKNCTCIDGVCVGCDNFPCGLCGSIDNCKCTSTGCEGDDDGECQDKEKLEQIECYLKGSLELKSKCQCMALGTSIQVVSISEETGDSKINHKVKFELDLRKKWNSNQLGYENEERFVKSTALIHNDFPTTANYTLQIVGVYLDWKGSQFENSVPVNSGEIMSGTGASQTTVVQTDSIKIGSSDINFGEPNTSKLIGYKLIVKVGEVNFEAKNCLYAQETIYENYIQDISATTVKSYLTISRLQSSSTRNPKLTVTRDGDIIRSLYKEPLSNGYYEDSLYGPKKLTLLEKGKQTLSKTELEGELIPLSEYTFDWDCGCDTSKTLTLVKCDPKMQEWAADNHFEVYSTNGEIKCNDTIKGLNSFEVCPFNQDLSKYNYPASLIADKQTKYIVKATLVNGNTVLVATLVHNGIRFVLADNPSQSWEGFVKQLSDTIVSVSIQQNHDEVECKAEDTIELDLEADVISECENGSPSIVVSENRGSIKGVKINNSSTLQAWSENDTTETYSGEALGILNKSKNTVTVVFNGGCTKTYETEIDCCAEDSAIVENTEISFDGLSYTFNISTLKGAKMSSIKFDSDANSIELNNSIFETINRKVSPNSSTFSGQITTIDGCVLNFSGNYIVTNSPPNIFTINPSIICEDGSVTYSIESDGEPNTPIQIQTPTGVISGFLDINGNFEESISNVASMHAGDYTLIQFGNTNPNLTKTLTVTDNPILQSLIISSTIQSTYCEEEEIQLQATGTSGSSVEVLLGDGREKIINIPSSSQNMNSGFITISYPNAGNYTIEANQIQNGNCGQETVASSISVEITQGIDLTVNTSCVGDISTNTVKFQIQANNATSVKIYEGTTLIDTLSDLGGYNFNKEIANMGGKTLRILAENSSNCDKEVTITTPDCECLPINPPTVSNSEYVCGAGATKTITLSNLAGHIIEFFTLNNNTDTPDYTGNIQTLSVGTYKVRYKNTTTGCTSNFTNFQISDGTVHFVDMYMPAGSPANSVVGDFITFNADPTVSTPPGNADLIYSWFYSLDGGSFIAIPNGNNNSLTYQIPTEGDYVFKVTVRRGTTSCLTEATFPVTVGSSCEPSDLPELLSIANQSGPCGNPTATTNGQQDTIEWVVNGSVVSTSLIWNTASLASGSSTDYTVILKKAGCPDQEYNYTYTKNIDPEITGGCLERKLDVVFLVDNSGSVSGSEITSVIQGVNDLIASISADIPDSRFALMRYANSSDIVYQYSAGFNYTSADWGPPNLGTDTQEVFEDLQTHLAGSLSPRNDAELIIILISDDADDNYPQLGSIISNIESTYSARNVVIQFNNDNNLFKNEVATTLNDYYFENLFSNFPDITDNITHCELAVINTCVGATFEWSTGETTQTISAPPGTYSVTVTCQGGCTYDLSFNGPA